MSYPGDILSTRAVIKHGNYAVIPQTGLVNNVIPGIEGCRVSILCSPKMGAGFVMYIVEAEPNGGTTDVFADGADEEAFVYTISGNGVYKVFGKQYEANEGSYIYSPPGAGLEFTNTGSTKMKLVLYKQLFIPLGDKKPPIHYDNVNNYDFRIYDNMENVFIKDLLPTDIVFDMNFHILSFAPGGCHPFVETHVQEHGAYILEGEGCYYLGDDWRMIKKDDFVWFGPFTPQAAYGVGRTNFTYIYSKDCNRDAAL